MNADAAFQLLASVYSANDSTFFSDNIVQHRNGLIKAFQCLLGLDNTAFDVWQSSVDEAVVVDAIEVFFENQLKHFAFENASIQRLVLIFLLRIAGWNDSSTGTAASNTLQKHTSTFISVQILLCLSVSFKSGGYVEFLVMRSCSTSTNHTKSFDFSTQFVTYLAAQCRLLNQRRTQFEQLGRGKGKADDRVISDSQSQPHSSPPSSTSLPALLEFLRDLSLTCTKIDSFFRLDCHPQDLHDFFPPQSFMKEIATFYNESLAVIRKSFLLVFSKEHSDSTNVLLEAFVNVKLACIRMVDSVLRCLFADSFDQTLLNAATMPFNLEASTPTPPTLDSSIRSSLISCSDFTTTSPPTSSKSLNFNAPSFTPISSHIASVNVPVSSSTTTALDGKNSAAMDTYATNMSRSKSIVIKPYTEKSLSNFLLCMAGESEKQLRDSHDAGIRHYLQDTSILADLDRLTQLQSRVALSNNDEAKDLLKLIEDVTRDNDDAFLTRIISSMEVQEQNTPSLSQVERPTTTWEHLHSKVADLFPDLGLGFIDACLTFFEGNAEAVIESLCENQLPGPLHYLSRSLGLAAISQNTTSPVNGGIGAITAFTIEPPQNSLIASPQVIAEAIKSVKGLFPSLGSGFIECCLDFYQLDVQRLIADLCDNNLPPAVAHLDSSMTQWQKNPINLQPPSSPSVPPSSQALPPPPLDDKIKRNILHKFSVYEDEYDDAYDETVEGNPMAGSEVGEDGVKEAMLMEAYVRDPALFDRRANVRRSNGRQLLKNRTNMTDEQLEGWRGMMERKPNDQSLLHQHTLVNSNHDHSFQEMPPAPTFNFSANPQSQARGSPNSRSRGGSRGTRGSRGSRGGRSTRGSRGESRPPSRQQ